MKVPHEKFCVLPWISMETSPTGTVRPCCLAEDEIVDNNGKPLELASTPFSEIQNSNHMKTLRQEFLDGKRPKTCQKCWDEEDAGRTSKRMHTLDRLKHMISDNIEWGEDAEPLMFLDLKLGNICNLKCRICGSWSSSAFATEELQNMPRERKKSSFQYMMLKKGAWPREKTEFWSELEDILSQIRYIDAGEEKQNDPIYPDMNLYQEILFLQGYYDGDYVVENVNGWYDPLIEPQKRQRHYFWSNFQIPPIDLSKSNIYEGTVSEWESDLGFDLSKYDLTHNKRRKILRNCVKPKLGEHILNVAIKNRQTTLF